MAKGVVRSGVQEKRFRSGEQWEVLRQEEAAVIVGKNGVEKHLPLDQTRKFSVFEREKITLAIGDRIRFTKNVKHRGHKFLNNELRTVVGSDEGKITFTLTPRPRHRDVKLCFVRLAERPNPYADNDLVDSLGLAGDSYCQIEMEGGAVSNNLALVEYDLAIINGDHGPELVIEELVPAVFDVFRESDPVAD